MLLNYCKKGTENSLMKQHPLNFLYPKKKQMAKYLCISWNILYHYTSLEQYNVHNIVRSSHVCQPKITWNQSLSPLSAAEWSQALLHGIKTEPLHQQEHQGYLPGFHRETGLYWCLVTIKTFFLLLLHVRNRITVPVILLWNVLFTHTLLIPHSLCVLYPSLSVSSPQTS